MIKTATFAEMLGVHEAEGITPAAAKANLMPFCQFVDTSYEAAPHLVTLGQHLEALERGELRRLIVVMPPRHGKSFTISTYFPAWFLGRNPDRQVIACSHTESLALTFSRAVRSVIQSPRYQRLWAMDLELAGAGQWQLRGKQNKRPSYVAAGVGGAITGEGAHLLVIDDPFRSRQDAESKAIRTSFHEWYKNVARPRLEPGGVIVLVTTRWCLDDAVGMLKGLEKADPKADRWTTVHFPAIDENGEALWPGRFPVDELLKVKASIGGRDFETLYQGNPVAAEGNIFKREYWRFITQEQMDETQREITIQAWDTSFKSGTHNDFSVCLTMAKTQTGYIVTDMWRHKVEFPELTRAAQSLYARDLPSLILIEDAASGQSLAQIADRETALPVKRVHPTGDKVSRANSVSGLVESGRVSLPEGAPWVADFIDELAAFPSAAHDDIVDAFVHGLTYLRQFEASGIDSPIGIPGRSLWRTAGPRQGWRF